MAMLREVHDMPAFRSKNGRFALLPVIANIHSDADFDLGCSLGLSCGPKNHSVK
jgi:hypothetical protein